MRLNFRAKFRNVTFFTMLATTQTIEGLSSLQEDESHIIMFDSKDDCDLYDLEECWRTIQQEYGLSDVFIVSDKIGSYRVWCLTKVDFATFLKILLDAYDYIDYNFFYYTVKRKKATLRTGSKKDRPTQRVVSVLKSYPVSFSHDNCVVEKVIYDTGLEKIGKSILIGDD